MFHMPEQPPYRPPSEAGSVLVRVTRGCPWNRCTFCGMYKQLHFEIRSPDEIERDLAGLRAFFPQARSIFLADSDSLVHPELLSVVKSIKHVFPEAGRITSYARLTTLRRRPLEQLCALREAGLTRIHAGLESGSARILTRVRKGIVPEQAIDGGARAIQAGFELSLYVLSGLGGEDDWEEHARETARVVREVWPHFLRLRSLVLLPETPLGEQYESGSVKPASPLTRLRETRLLTELLSPPAGSSGTRTAPSQASRHWSQEQAHGEKRSADSRPDHGSREQPDGERRAAAPLRELEICSDHFSNMIWADRRRVYDGINGSLPSDRDLLLEVLDEAIKMVRESDLALDPGSMALRGKTFSLYRPTSL